MFRGPENALQPDYKHLPVGYHGRFSSVVVSRTAIKRPSDQILPPGHTTAVLSPSKKLDIELELAAFICKENQMGYAIPISKAKEYILGAVLMKDWSARDIQAWEYVPLGSFLAKSFATTISPWIVLSCTLESFRTTDIAPGNRKSLLPYLQEDEAENAIDINMSVYITTRNGNTSTICKSSSKDLLYTFPRILAHHSINGCPMKTGDLLGSGTISGQTRQSLSSLLEQSLNGKEPIKLENGDERTFLEAGDEITIRKVCRWDGGNVGSGNCVGKIVS
jgi:fumarylacetoacetase